MCDDFKQELTNGWEFLDHRQDLCFRLLLLVIPLLSLLLHLPFPPTLRSSTHSLTPSGGRQTSGL